ncbi:hypothetical protein [Rathayibacter rathayi]|uniref:Big-1 domain-containing protein n=1 Tax=Rathayibacter rathayi TaxID=33887 RepID=A0ABX5A9Y7_RATRA|nr:hypothetical protein [Rathayibacter rathayi]AZZ47814.1 hypothetical protein C1O28_00220 [Rathayibacter rathayi]MWV75066.1 hypothetical protein [Rathayibacter rathayi NCPPB 2980 = VKM Ac-1601]PPF21127.1 hypothetical protein C5C34_13515 [Rathayibacter rathayi]PPF44329.1 hypothetical protein C5C08_13460 [Rathayibacter rathayi]PPG14563.1 hypothetical protein C5C11_04330 [Rathayibacter rathayi]
MTNNSFDKFRDIGSPLSDWTIPAEDGVHRRTIVKGAAWTIPVVAVSVATPAAAASKTPTLAFTKGSYTGNGCETITGVQVKRTTDGTTADAGKTVTVTLKDGFTFADGKTTYSATTDSSGLITLPDIKVPTGEKSTTFNATSDTLSASAPVTSTAYAIRSFHKSASSTDGSSSLVEAGYKDATVYGDSIFLTSDGTLYNGASSTPQEISKNVTSVSQVEYDSKDNLFLNYVTKSGEVRIFKKDSSSNTGSSSDVKSGQSDATAYGDKIYLTSGGTLYFGSDSIGTDVKSVSQVNYDSTDGIYIDFVTSSGEVRQFHRTGATGATSTSSITTGKTGATALGDNLYLDSSKELFAGTTSIAKNVTSASQVQYDNKNGIYMNYVTENGDVYSYYKKSGDATGTSTKITSDQKGATALGDKMYLTSDGTLYNDTQLVNKNVTSASQIEYDSTNGFYMDYVTSSNSSC